MGLLRLWVEPNPGAETSLPLPDYWDELDDDEKDNWVIGKLREFRTSKTKSGFELTE